MVDAGGIPHEEENSEPAKSNVRAAADDIQEELHSDEAEQAKAEEEDYGHPECGRQL